MPRAVALVMALGIPCVTAVHAATPAIPVQPTTRPALVQGIVVNGSGVDVGEAEVNRLFRERIGAPRGLAGLMLLRPSCGADPESLFDAALVEHGAAQRTGEMYNDAIAWLVCQDPPYTAFTYGEDNPLAGYLEPPIVAQAMSDALADGGLAGAASAGLAAVATQLDRAPLEISARPTPIPAPTPAPLDSDNGGHPIALTLTWAIVGALALVALGWLGRRRDRAPAATETEPPAVRELDAHLTQVAQRLVSNSPTLDRVIHALEPLGDATRLGLLRRHQTMVHRAEALARDAEVVGHLRAAGELPERGDEGLRRVEDLLVEARALVVYTRQLEREAQRAGRLHDGAQAILEEAALAIETAGANYEAIRPASPPEVRRLPHREAAFAVPAALLASARECAASGALLEAGCRADDAFDLAARIIRIARRLRRIEGAVIGARQRFDRLTAHDPAAWSEVVGNGAEAEASLDAAAAGLDVALTATAADLGPDPAAGLASGLAVVAQELARARQLIAAIDARARHLAEAQAMVLEHRVAARAALAEAHVRAAAAPTGARAALAAAAEAAQRADAAAGAVTADWMTALERWSMAERSIAEAVAHGLGEGTAPSAAERAAHLARSYARATVDRAERTLEAHRRDCAPTAVRRVAAGAALLREAEHARERRVAPAAVADAYQHAARTATAAFEMLTADVRRAERRRIGWLPRGDGAVTVDAMAGVRRVHPFAGRLGPWEALRPTGPPRRPGAWGAMPPGAPERPPGW